MSKKYKGPLGLLKFVKEEGGTVSVKGAVKKTGFGKSTIERYCRDKRTNGELKRDGDTITLCGVEKPNPVPVIEDKPPITCDVNPLEIINFIKNPVHENKLKAKFGDGVIRIIDENITDITTMTTLTGAKYYWAAGDKTKGQTYLLMKECMFKKNSKLSWKQLTEEEEAQYRFESV